MENCQCKTSGSGNFTCVICQAQESRALSEFELKDDCKLHRVIMICGRPEFVCQSCKAAGWYSTAGWGGGTRHLNNITGEEKPIKKPKKGPIF